MYIIFLYCTEYGPECKSTVNGTDYQGKVAVTVTGKTCQPWTAQSPHSHTRNNQEKFPDATLADAENFCRNPDNTFNGPWCYTMERDTRWERCDVPACEEIGEIEKEFISVYLLVACFNVALQHNRTWT